MQRSILKLPRGKSIVLDPWMMNNPACLDNKKSFKKINVMLCTHGRGDHIGDAVELTKNLLYSKLRSSRGA